MLGSTATPSSVVLHVYEGLCGLLRFGSYSRPEWPASSFLGLPRLSGSCLASLHQEFECNGAGV